MGENAKEKKVEKCFVIMPISDQGDYPAGHFAKVYEQIIKPAITDAGYEPYRVDENNICDAIMNKIFAAIQECPMAICDLSNRNPNVLYELGLRQAYDKPVVLIQDEKTDKIFDVSGISTVFYKSGRLYEDVIEARENITSAILATKEGKVKSLAKIMKASVPDFSQVEVSQDDKINVILDGIYSELRRMNDKDVKANKHNDLADRKVTVYEMDLYELKKEINTLSSAKNTGIKDWSDLENIATNIINDVLKNKEISASNQHRLLCEFSLLLGEIQCQMSKLN